MTKTKKKAAWPAPKGTLKILKPSELPPPSPPPEATTPAPPTNPIETVAMLLEGAGGIAATLRFWSGIRNRMNSYRKLHPERYGHMVSFCEDGVDDPTPEQVQAVVARAAAVFERG